MKHQNQNNSRKTGLDKNRLIKHKADVEESQETPLMPQSDSICARERGVETQHKTDIAALTKVRTS